jgi:hypothetical protein
LDEYKILHHITLPKSDLNLDCGDVTDRRQIRKKLECKNFQWYLNNIYPELMDPAEGDFAFGSLLWNHPTWLKCLDRSAPGEELLIGSQMCLQTYYPQRFRLSSKGHLAQDDFCLTMNSKEEVLEGVVNQVIIEKIQGIKEKKGEETKFFITSRLCVEGGTDDQQLWERHRPPRKVYEETGLAGFQIRLIAKNTYCFDTSKIESIGALVAKECDVKSKFQRFQFDYQIVKV